MKFVTFDEAYLIKIIDEIAKVWLLYREWGGEIAQWLASLSVKLAVQVRAQHDPFVFRKVEFYQVLFMLLTCSHQY